MLGSARRRQRVPFQAMANDAVRPEEPTARQKRLEAHETPDRRLPRTEGRGVDCTAHLVPFHVSTTGRVWWPAKTWPATYWRPGLWVYPTATQNVGAVQETDS